MIYYYKYSIFYCGNGIKKSGFYVKKKFKFYKKNEKNII